jgi:hypothetical protein
MLILFIDMANIRIEITKKKKTLPNANVHLPDCFQNKDELTSLVQP